MNLPEAVPFADVVAALNRLGISEVDDIMSVHIDPRCITVEQARLSARGGALAVGNDLATVTTTIGIDRRKHD